MQEASLNISLNLSCCFVCVLNYIHVCALTLSLRLSLLSLLETQFALHSRDAVELAGGKFSPGRDAVELAGGGFSPGRDAVELAGGGFSPGRDAVELAGGAFSLGRDAVELAGGGFSFSCSSGPTLSLTLV